MNAATLLGLIGVLLLGGSTPAAGPTLAPDPGGVISRKEPFTYGLAVNTPWGGALVMSLPEFGFDREGAGTLWSYTDATTSLWTTADDKLSAGLSAESKNRPGIFLLGKAAVEAPDKVRLTMTIDNRTDKPVKGFITSFCNFYRLVPGFPSWKAGFPRSYVVLGGKTVSLAETRSTDPASLARGALIRGSELPQVSEWTRNHKGDLSEKLDLPLVVVESLDRTHRIAISWTPAGQMLSNSDNPCIHCDPRFGEAPARGQSLARGVLWFTDEALETIVAKFRSGELAADPALQKKP